MEGQAGPRGSIGRDDDSFWIEKPEREAFSD